MGNLYTDNLIGTVIGLSVADDWEGARREWEIVGCEVDEIHSATCVCGKEGLRYVYTIANTETGETLSPIGSSCIKKFEQSDMDEELAGWQQAIKLMEEAARIGKEDYVHLHSGSYSRKLLYFLYEQDAFRPTKYNGYDGYNDYLFLLDMFNGGFCSEAQERKCQAIGISCQGDCFQVAVVTQECSEGSGRVFDGIDFVFAVDGNPRWRHLGFLVSGRAGNPAEKAWERVRRHPLFHAFSALALIEYQCSPAKAALRVARFGKWVLKVHSSGLFNSLPSCSRAAFGALTGGRLRLETRQFRITEFS